MRQPGLLLRPCVGSVKLLCPRSKGGNATVKLSPNGTTVELNDNHHTISTHNSHAEPFVASCHCTSVRQRYIFQLHIGSYFFVRWVPTSFAHSLHFYLSITSSSPSSFFLSHPTSFPRQLRVPGVSLASQVSSPLAPIFPLTVNPSWVYKLSVNHSFPLVHLLALALCGMPLFYSVAHLHCAL